MTLDDLIAYGANVEEGLGRCMNNEEFYLRLVEKMKADENFDTLQKAVEDGQLNDAFEAAHALKGALGNLAITPLYEPLNEITELLRVEADVDYAPLLARIADAHERFLAL